jgi:FixJ family two-component response regulator
MSAALPLIAIVDDEESVRRALERLLRSAEMEARVFASGESFLAALADLRPDCLVLDLHMPGASGFEIMARVQARLPVVIITGHDTPEAEARSLAGGAAFYLRKPINDRVLLEAIATAIASSGQKKGEGRQGAEETKPSTP